MECRFQCWENLKEYRKDYEDWLECRFKDLKLEHIETRTRHVERTMRDLSRKLLTFSSEEETIGEMSVLQKLGSKVASVKSLLPVLRLLLKDYFKPKHWSRVLDEMRNKDTLLSGPFFTLKNLISGGIKEKIGEIQKVHREAVSESKMEKEIEKIRSEWECTELSLKPFGENRARVVLTQSEEMLLMIEKHLDKIYQMRKFEQINEVY